jgi:hypothetical protein
MQSAILALDDEIPEAVKMASTLTTQSEMTEGPARPKPARQGLIGEGKGSHLNKAQRKRAL